MWYVDIFFTPCYDEYDGLVLFYGGAFMERLFVLGSLNMDISIETDQIPRTGETVHGYDFMMSAGGKGGNQAAAGAKSGADVYMIGSVGKDAYGDILLEDLMKLGIHTQYIERSQDNDTGCALIWRSKGDNRIVLNHGANYDVTMRQVMTCLKDMAKANDIFLTQLECRYLIVQQSLHYAKQMGLYTIFNPAPARPLSYDIYRNVDLIIVNETECECITGIYPSDNIQSQNALKYFKKQGCDAIITLGPKGSVALIQGAVYGMAAFSVEVVDTTAAGDTYIGALCRGLLQQYNIVETMRYATAASALSVLHKGAQKTIPSDTQIQCFLKEHTMEL